MAAKTKSTGNDKQQTPMETIEHVSEVEINNIMSKYDRESAYRILVGKRGLVISLVLVAFSLLQLYSTWRVIPSTHMRPIHLGVVMMLAYFLYPARKNGAKDKLPWYDLVLGILSLLVCLYQVFDFEQLAMQVRFQTWKLAIGSWTIEIPYQHIIGGALIVLLLEACRRVVGIPIVVIAIAFMCVGFFGRSMPGFLLNKGFKLKRVIQDLVYTQTGIFGTPLGASSTFIFLFILFGSFLEKTGVGEFFIDLSNAIAGHQRGGPAKVAVLTSALEGTVSGSSVANTVGSGSFTIPMMKKLGYRPEFAAAVEAAASTGGQIMPPVMGAAAFLMCDAVGVPYGTIVKAAIIPALLYFAGIWIVTDLEARKQGLRGMTREEMPHFKSVMLQRGYLILPLVVIIAVLAIGYTPSYAALLGILTAVLGSYLRTGVELLVLLTRGVKIEWLEKEHPGIGAMSRGQAVKECLRKTRGMHLKHFYQALEGGARSIIGVALACGVAGIISGMITLTGVGLNLGTGLAALAGGNLFLILLMTMLASILLGMGVPTTANYLITSTMMAGIVARAVYGNVTLTPEMLLPAHMFTFYFGIVADITPPVALAAMAGAAIAKSNPLKTGVEATKLAIAAFLVPFMFVLNPQMLMIGAHWYEIMLIIVTSMIGMLGVGMAMEKFWLTKLNWMEQLLSVVGGLLLIIPGWQTDVIGIVLVGAAILWQVQKKKKLGAGSAHA